MNPVTLNEPPLLQGIAVASSQATRVTGSAVKAPLFCEIWAVIELDAIPLTASATVKCIVTGGETESPFSGLALNRNGIDGTSISPPPTRAAATIVTSVGALSKLGAAGRVGSQASPIPGGVVAHVLVVPAGAGANEVAKPASVNWPSPSGRPSSTKRRWPLDGSTGTVCGSTARQHRDPSEPSKVMRTV